METVRAEDSQVLFVPHRLNRQPAVVRGLTADELWFATTLFALIGLGLSLPLAVVVGQLAVLPTGILITLAVGLYLSSGLLQTLKRGRPDTWLHRHLQWQVATCLPLLAAWVGGQALILRSGTWSTRRSRPVLRKGERWS